MGRTFEFTESMPLKSSDVKFSSLVTIKQGFHRSASIATDIGNGLHRDSYLLNELARQHCKSILQGVIRDFGSKAWAITGPFGSGKSSFATFFADLVSDPKTNTEDQVRLRTESGFGRLAYQVIPLVGRRVTLREILDTALYRSTSPRDDIHSILDARVEQARSLGYDGIVIILDEFNRVLEYEARHPLEGDMSILQSLAEYASRSNGSLVVITIQHMSFAEYVSVGASSSVSDEWRKVQGRFQELPFFLPHAQSLELIAAAISTEDLEGSHVWRGFERTVDFLGQNKVFTRAIPLEFLKGVWPLHPITAAVATEVFRGHLSQNERSLFAFLTSSERYGFVEFLMNTQFSDETVFELADLYDYVQQSLGFTNSGGPGTRSWTQTGLHLENLPGSFSSVHERIVKTVQLVNEFGKPLGLYATEELLKHAIGGDLDEAISSAVADLLDFGVLRQRNYRGDIAIASDTDFDIESALRRAFQHIGEMPLSNRLASLGDASQRRIARRHYIKTGNIRTISQHIIDGDDLESWQPDKSPNQDLQLIYVIPQASSSVEGLIALAKSVTKVEENKGYPAVFAILKEPEAIASISEDAAALAWVLENDETLSRDMVGRREVLARKFEHDSFLSGVVGSIFGWRGSQIDPALCIWVEDGSERHLSDAAALHELIDDLLENAFPLAPSFFNELVNRNTLSSAAARARRELITAMLLRHDQKRLGIEGYPPEAAIYESLLLKSNFHIRDEDGVWQLSRPTDDWGKIWDQVSRMIQPNGSSPIQLDFVAERLALPPFGIKSGLIPLFLSIYLIANQNQVSLFEEGTYVAEIRPEVFERLLRKPDSFAVKSTENDPSSIKTITVLQNRIEELEVAKFSVGAGLIDVVRVILQRVAGLPQFAKRTNRFLEHPSAAIARETILRAKDPHKLVFQELPRVFGIEDLEVEEQQRLFADQTAGALVSLLTSYSRLLEFIGKETSQVFGFGVDQAANGELMDRMMPLLRVRPPGPQGRLISALSMTTGDWRENVGRAVMEGKPTDQWDDLDSQAFKMKVRQVGTMILDLEALVKSSSDCAEATVASVTVLGHGVEAQQVRRSVSFDPREQESIDRLGSEIMQIISNSSLSSAGSYAALIDTIVKLSQSGE